jgi:lambda family phage portal protein
MPQAQRSDLFENLIDAFQARIQTPAKSRILDKSGAPIVKPESIQFHRLAGKKTGTMKKWRPSRLGSDNLIADERVDIVERSIDLSNNDPNAAGVVDTFASTIVGSGLRPHPKLDSDALGLSDDQIGEIEEKQKRVYRVWNPFADAAARMSFNQIQFLAQREIVQYGEFLFLIQMLDDPLRPYSLALQTINPLRLKTPIDLNNEPNIKDGVETGRHGEPKAYWIKKSAARLGRSLDISTNFVRIPARAGHRFKVLHGFPVFEPEQVRGLPFFSPGMKFFRDLSDYLDAELVSAIVTAAFSVFIETGDSNPYTTAQAMQTITETGYKSDFSTYDERYEELEPGSILYGNTGEKPHTISADRPGRTFEPFIKSILKSISNSVGIPYPVLFKDFDNMNYASYRSAMLEAWRVFKSRRGWLGEKLCQPIWNMLIEESYLRKEIKMPKFYKNFWQFLECDWIGPPKGQIEPIKEVQAEILAINNHLKSREESALEAGRDFRPTMEQIAKEQSLMDELEIEPPDAVDATDTEPVGNPQQLQLWPSGYYDNSGNYIPYTFNDSLGETTNGD